MKKQTKEVTLKQITREYISPSKETFRAVNQISLEIHAGEFVTLLGPSGCGKTTTLRMIAGFETPTEGEIYIGGECVNALTPDKRDTAMVFQSYALFPHYNVYNNISFGLRLKKLPEKEISERVHKIMELVGLTGMEERFPNQLSGGQQQRVALARTLTQDPHIILADEPVAALDPVTAKQVMEDFVHINQELGISILLNIHHVELALEYADRIIGIRAGKIVYDGPSKQVDQAVLDAIYGEDTASEAAV